MLKLQRALGRTEALSRFLSPNVASILRTDEERSFLQLHRTKISVLFIDLRGFTSFSERESPDQVMDVLATYYRTVGNAALRHKGTLGHLAGDGIMVFFNDPHPIPNHQDVALHMAMEARDALNIEKEKWRSHNFSLDFGIGLAEGFATIGEIGFDHFSQHSVIGAAVNFAARMCSMADKGQVLVSRRYRGTLRCPWEMESMGEMRLKGVDEPVAAFNVLSVQS